MNWYFEEIKHIHNARRFPSKKFFKYLWQFITTGCTDIDTWSVDYTVSRKILPVLKRYRGVAYRHIDSDETFKEVDFIIETFEKINADEISPFSVDFSEAFEKFKPTKYWW